MKAKDIDAIVIHCSATTEGRDFHAADFDRWHRDRGFSKIGYHYVIDLDGTIEKGRPEDEVGAHANTAGLSGRSYNYHSIGICYVGGLDYLGKPKDTRTTAQKKAMHKLVSELMERYPNIIEVIGHRDTSPDKDGDGEVEPKEWIKSCPCFDVRAEFPMAVCRASK